MLIFQTVSNAFDSQKYEQQIREGVDDLSGVDGCIVVL